MRSSTPVRRTPRCGQRRLRPGARSSPTCCRTATAASGGRPSTRSRCWRTRSSGDLPARARWPAVVPGPQADRARLLYRNPILQPANLALRNAWFAGGVEWNIGTIGHSPTTCEPLHAARVLQPDGTPVLRMYEFERMREVVFQVDAWLPEDSPVLLVHVQIVNPSDTETPMYWWSNSRCRRRTTCASSPPRTPPGSSRTTGAASRADARARRTRPYVHHARIRGRRLLLRHRRRPAALGHCAG